MSYALKLIYGKMNQKTVLTITILRIALIVYIQMISIRKPQKESALPKILSSEVLEASIEIK